MVKPIEELMNDIRTKIGEDTSDEALTLIENVNDTITDLSNKAKNNIDWEQRYNDNDKQWRERYRDRFFNSESQDDEEKDETESTHLIKFEDLFKEG